MGMMVRRGHGSADDEHQSINPKLLGRLFRFAAPYKTAILLGIGGMAVATGAGLVQPLILRRAIDVHVVSGDLGGLARLGLLYLATGVVAWVAGFYQAKWTAWAGQNALHDVRTQLFSHISSQSMSFFDRRKAGELMSRLINDINAMAELISSIFVLVAQDVLLLVGIVAIMFALDAPLTFASLLIAPLLWFALTRFQTRLLEAFRLVRRKTGEVNATLQESISGVRETQAFGREEKNLQAFDRVNLEQMRANVKATYVWARFLPLIEILAALSLAVVLFYGGARVSSGALTLGTLVAFINYVQRFIHPLRTLSQIFNQVQSAMASSERIFEILDTAPDVVNAPDAVPAGPIRHGIRFEKVTFGYKPDEPVLHSVDLEIERGERIALVGPTGAGKTSIINLICRFYDPQDGAVTVDGVDLRRLDLRSWRSRLGIVPQETFLFSTTVAENIRFGRPDADDAAVRAAAEAVGAHAFIERLPKGYETEVHERGVRLSMGERQLIAFARALLRDPDLLILDEATAHIDSQAEAIVQEALFRLIHGRTAIIIAHRLSTIRACDKIVVVEDGRLAEQGSHDDLLRLGGLYAELHQASVQA